VTFKAKGPASVSIDAIAGSGAFSSQSFSLAGGQNGATESFQVVSPPSQVTLLVIGANDTSTESCTLSQG